MGKQQKKLDNATHILIDKYTNVPLDQQQAPNINHKFLKSRYNIFNRNAVVELQNKKETTWSIKNILKKAR
jgi:hypothetical protein